MSRYSLDKLRIYSSLGVPEIWRLKDMELTIYRLHAKGKYIESEESSVLPMLPLEVLRDFLARWESKSETALVLEFEEWVTSTLRKA